MKRTWKRAKEGFLDAETQAYESIVERITTQNIQEINDLPVPSSWAEITALKILFPDDFFASRHAVVAQEKFPKANIDQWKFNESGPTSARGWKENPFRFLPKKLIERLVKDKQVQDTTELLKRPRSSEAAGDFEEDENPSKKRRLTSPSTVYDTFEDTVKDTAENTAEDVEDTVADPSTSKQATHPLPDTPGDSDDSEDSNEFWSDFDHKLTPIRKAAKEGTEITPRMLNSVRKAHLKELKKQHPDKLFKKMKKQHARELRQVRARYEGVITTWLKGVASEVKVLQTTRRELSMSEDYKD
jgi:hypothetical protein